MELFLFRHGPAEAKTDWTGDDVERPLSEEGRLVISDIADSLKKHQVFPDLVLTSPYARAKQTAQIVGERLGLPPDKVMVDARLIPGFGSRQLGKVLRDHADCERLMVVGHGPDLTHLARTMTGGRLSIRKGGVAHIEVADPLVIKGRLVALHVPASLHPEDESAGESN